MSLTLPSPDRGMALTLPSPDRGRGFLACPVPTAGEGSWPALFRPLI